MSAGPIRDAPRVTMAQAQQIRVSMADLDDLPCLRAQGPPETGFLPDQEDDVRVAAWNAALDVAEAMVRAKLRQCGVDA